MIFSKTPFLLGASLMALSFPSVGLAQQPAAPGLLEEIVVTAQKREQNLQDVGISVTAFSGDQLRGMQVDNSTDLVRQVPSLKMNEYSPTATVFNIRGVSQNGFDDHLEPPVAVYFDDSYMSALGGVNAQMFDVERVEVLRGPQGTLFGRNATGGLIRIVGKKPTEQVDGYGEIQAGEQGYLRAQAAAGGPLSQSASFRLSGLINRRGAYIENRRGDDVGTERDGAVRGQLAFGSGDNFSARLTGRYTRTNNRVGAYSFTPAYPAENGLGRLVPANLDPFGTCRGCDLIGYKEADQNPYTNSYNIDSRFKRNLYGASANLVWTADNFTVTSITDYSTFDKKQKEDSDGSPNDVLNISLTQDLDQFYQELRVEGDTDSSRWVFGANYLDIFSRTQTTFTLGEFGFVSTGQTKLRTSSLAGFGQAEFDLSDNWTAITGLRYTGDQKTVNWFVKDNGGTIFAVNRINNKPRADQDFNDWSAKLELDWKPNDQTLAYASFNRGTKGGSFSTGPLAPADLTALVHNGEVLNSYEIGLKSDLAGRALRLNTSAFYYDYNDYQSFFFINAVGTVRNNDASVKGLEVELTANPVEGLEALVGASFLDTKVKKVGLPDGKLVNRELPQAPKFSANWLLRYNWSAGNGTASAQFDGNYSDSFSYSVVAAPVEIEPRYAVGNLRLNYTGDSGDWDVYGYVQNVWDQRYSVYRIDVSGLGFAQVVNARPRTVGAGVRYRFGG